MKEKRRVIIRVCLFAMAGAAILAVNSLSAIAENSSNDSVLAGSSDVESPSNSIKVEASVAPVTTASDIVDLKFDEFFKMPVGRYGLEMTDKLKSLDGKKVRLRGFMVKEDRCRGGHAHNPADADKEVVKGRFMLSPAPVMVSYACFGTSDDLLPQTVFVKIPELANKPVPYSSTPLELIGTLSVGPSQEPDDRISQVRLVLDPLPVSVISQLERASAPTSQNHKECDDSSHSH